MSNITSKPNIEHREPEMSKYYEGVATAFRYAKFITLVVIVLFVVFLLSLFREEITLQNFRYTLKYISSDESSLITTNKIYYPTSDSKALYLFNGDFVSAGSSGISLYDTYGNTVIEIDKTFSQPFMTFGKKFGLCYDLSGNSYTIFSSFAELHNEKTDQPIADAVMAYDGSYAILTDSREYKTVINLYNSDFELTSRVLKDEYTFALDLVPKYLAYASVKSSDSKYLATLNIVKTASENQLMNQLYYDEFPVSVEFVGNNLVFLTDKYLRFYGQDFNVLSEISLANQAYNNFAASDSYIMLCFGKNIIGSENEIRLYDNDGALRFSHVISGKINNIDVGENYAVLLTNSSVIRLDLLTNTAEECFIDSGAFKVMLQSDSTALVCYSNYAELIDFKNADRTSAIKNKEN